MTTSSACLQLQPGAEAAVKDLDTRGESDLRCSVKPTVYKTADMAVLTFA